MTQEERVRTPPARKRLPTPPNPDDEHIFVPLPGVKPREQPERKQIKIELSKAVPLPPSTPPSKNESFAKGKSNRIFVLLAQPSAPPPPPPPPPLPLYDPDADNDSSNTATHLQDRIGEYEDMELDDLDEPEPASTDEQTSSTTFMEERATAPPVPPAPVASLYDDDDDDDNARIPTESNRVSSSLIFVVLDLILIVL